MAKSNSTAKKASGTTVTRITASDSGSVKKSTAKTKATKAVAKTSTSKAVTNDVDVTARRNPLQAMRDYFVGAWRELQQVRWPDRRNTWAMTGTLLAFTAFFVVIISLLDAFFKYLFELIVR